MKRLLFLTALLVCTLQLSAQKGGWYRTYSGVIGNMDAVLHLSSADQMSGYLYFSANPFPINVYATRLSGDSIELHCEDRRIAITARGIISPERLIGMARIGASDNPADQMDSKISLRADTSYMSFLFVYARTDARLPQSESDQPAFSWLTATIWPKEQSALSKLIKEIVIKQLDLKAADNPAIQLRDRGRAESKKWLQEHSKLTKEEIDDYGFSVSSGTQTILQIMYEDNRTITLAKFDYVFSGGAHGNYATRLSTLSKGEKKLLALTDVLNPEGIKQLPALLEDAARKQLNIADGPLEKNGFLVKKIPVTENFYLTRSGLGFIYNTYEILPYAAGEVNLLIPFNTLASYLQPAWR